MKFLFIPGALLGILTTSFLYAQGEGDKYVLNSLNMLLAANTIECDLRIETFVDGKKYAAWGQYAEQALPLTTPSTFLRSVFRLEINFSMNSPNAGDSEPHRMTFVCYVSEDGGKHQIDRYTAVGDAKSGDTIDLKRLDSWLRESGRDGTFRQVSEVRELGGLAGKMRQISHFYEFAPPTQEILQDEETIPVLKLTGTLRNVHRKDMLKQFSGLDKKGLYLSDFPSNIEIYLGRHNDFPYKIRYLLQSEKSSQQTLLLQESLCKVSLNGAPIPHTGVHSQFAPLKFPGDVFVRDHTEDFIKSLGL